MRAAILALALLTPPASSASGLTGNEIISTLASLPSQYVRFDTARNHLYVIDYSGNRIRRIDAAGVVTIVAGNGAAGNAGDGGPATAASLLGPIGIALDGAGNLYIADRGNNRVRKVDAATGLISNFAGVGGSSGWSGDGGPATLARLGLPWAVASGPDGSIYIADTDNQRIRRVAPSGVITTVAGNGLQVSAGPAGDGGPALQASFGNPVDLAVDGAGRIYVADVLQARVRRVDPDGLIHTLAGGGALTTEGTPGPQFMFSTPEGIALDAHGNVYVGEVGGGAKRVRKVDAAPPHAVTTVAGIGLEGALGDGGAARLARLSWPRGLALDATGSLYVSNVDRVRKVTAVQQAADLTLAKDAVVASIRLGREARFLLRVSNLGPDAASNVTLTDVPGAPIARIVSQPPWVCTPASTLPMVCRLATLAAGADAPPIEVALAPTAPGQACNSAVVTADQADPVPANHLPPPACVAVERAYALGEFVAFGNQLALLGARSVVRSGAVGANVRGNGAQVEVLVRGPISAHAGFFVIGDTVRLEGGRVEDVRANDPVQTAAGAGVGGQQPAGLLPLLKLPALQVANPETQPAGDVVVPANQSVTLAPGRYRAVTVNTGATLILRGYHPAIAAPGATPGYDFLRLDVRNGARILFAAPPPSTGPIALVRPGVVLRVQERVSVGVDSILSPLGMLNGSHIVFHVGGADGAASTPQSASNAVAIGARSSVRANFYAPNGTVFLGRGARAAGAFIGKAVAADAADLALESAF